MNILRGLSLSRISVMVLISFAVGLGFAVRGPAAVIRNLGFLELSHEIAEGKGDCTSVSYTRITQFFMDALAYRYGDEETWRVIIRAKGINDRKWIVDLLRSGNAGVSPELQKAIETAKSEFPQKWVSSSPWNYSRCRSVWDAWTVGLIEATNGNWSQAVAAYQAGIGLALGRVPENIVKEYYTALANAWLAQSVIGADQKLTAAKYLVLSGDTQRATDLFRLLATDSGLIPEQRCEAELSLKWLQRGEPDEIPPWPIRTVGDNECDDTLESSQSPEWLIAPNQALTDANDGVILIGFDLDGDVLEAGAEVIGRLYWQLPDGSIRQQQFRQPNLWPNSGNSWQPFGTTWACLPGYLEPSWITPCASNVVAMPSVDGKNNQIGHLSMQPDAIADTFLTSPSVLLPANHYVIYGGRWRINGDFPHPHVAYYTQGDQPNRYEVVLELGNVLPEGWTKLASIAPLVLTDVDVVQWIRPNMEGSGPAGDLWFDDLFSFVVPMYAVTKANK